MNRDESTPFDADPLAVEVFLRPGDPLSKYLDAKLRRKMAAAAAPDAAPTRELTSLLGSAAVRICEHASSVQEADREVVTLLGWVAIRTGAVATWFDGQHEGDGYRGRLTLNMQNALWGAPEFMDYTIARQHLAEGLRPAIKQAPPVKAVRKYRKYPFLLYHATEEPRGARNRKELQKMLAEGWNKDPFSAAAPSADPESVIATHRARKDKRAKPPRMPATVTVSVFRLKKKIAEVNEIAKKKGQKQLTLTPGALAHKSPSGGPHRTSWRKLLEGEPIRRDVLDHLIAFFKLYGVKVTGTDLITSEN
jgi:hypothetical protein